MTVDDIPRYRIQAVSQMTGIPAPTLRAWERRYGIPVPGRSGKGYRLYSARDVEMVSRMHLLLDSGMSAADAARMLLDALVEGEAPPVADDSDAWQQVSQRMVDATQRFDADLLDDQVRRAMVMGPATSIFERIFAPTMREVGEAWHRGELSVAQEHLCSQALGTASRSLLQLVQPPAAPRSAVLACFADEEHELPLLGIGFRLSHWGYRCVVLGARTPPEAVADAVARGAPDLVALSVTLSPPPARAAELVSGYRAAVGDTPWIVGGAATATLRPLLQEAGAMVHEGDLEELRRGLGRLRSASA